MVETQIKARGITSGAIMDAMINVPRHLFVPDDMQSGAYDDSPLPIGLGQTISQPYIVAYMTELLEPVSGMKILEIGSGSGYQAAVLAQLGCSVYSVELLEDLADRAAKTLALLNYENTKVKHGNGYMGWPEEAPFDAIIVTAAPVNIPQALIDQLKTGGRMIIPVGQVHAVQWLKLIEKTESGSGGHRGHRGTVLQCPLTCRQNTGEPSPCVLERTLLPVRFVPMVE